MAEPSGGQMGTLVFWGGYLIGEDQGMGLTAKSSHMCAGSPMPFSAEWGWGLGAVTLGVGSAHPNGGTQWVPANHQEGLSSHLPLLPGREDPGSAQGRAGMATEARWLMQ